MKQFSALFLIISAFSFAQITPPTELQAYYSGVDFTKTQLDLFDDLAIKTAAKHTNALSYTPGIWEASKITDEDPNNANNVELFYGYSDTDGNYVTDTTRDKDLNGGNAGTDWNREHVFPNSLANPDLDAVSNSGPPYADAHNLRPSDVTMNSNRGNRKFAAGSGNATNISGDWYPGDEFKGDAARIIMYMYVRYGTQCYPSFATQGIPNTIDPNMIDLLLQWNAEDPVSPIEDSRNAYHTDDTNTYGQGNRNPFIDNPYLATVIWGGMAAENRWGAQPPPDTEAPTVPTNLVASNPTTTTVDLAWTASTDNTGVTAYQIYVDGTFYVSTNSSATTYTVTGLSAETTYSFTIAAKDLANNTSAQSSADTETTLMGPPAGMNCVTEDFETIPANASNYATRTWTTSAGQWTATDARTDQILNGRAITVKNGVLTSPTVSGGIGDLMVTAQATFSADTAGAIDILVNGNFAGSISYQTSSGSPITTTIPNINVTGDITVVLDKQGNSNRVRIDDLSWTCFDNLSTPDFTSDKFTIYPNPINGSTLTVKTEINTAYTIFDMLGKQILKGRIDADHDTIAVEKLQRGVYILRLETANGSLTKKIIKE